VEAGNYNQHSATMNSLQDISQFRNQIFQNLGKGRNAFMDLMDAVLTSRSVSSDAVTLQERTYEHQPQPLGNKPVTLGQGYSTIAWIPETEGSWALPLLHERITSFEKPVDKAATQLRLAAEQVSNRILFLGDSEYACAPFINQTADLT
jgi:hypothetical protein